MQSSAKVDADQGCLTAFAPAKINLFLAVKGRRPDGYHDIETIFLPLSGLYDTVSLHRYDQPGIKVECCLSSVPVDHRNLCCKAALAFAEATSLEPAWRFVIDKKIPVSAGLGGGSADAAAALQLLNRLENTRLSGAELSGIARQIGADVPFFLFRQPALGGGIGDRLTPLVLNTAVPLVLLNPGGCPVSASWAYSTVAGEFDDCSSRALQTAMRGGKPADIGACSYNRFDRAVCEKVPLAAMQLDFLRARNCLAVHVSGSGPTVYGLCRTAEEAAVLVRAARRKFGRAVRAWADLAARSERGDFDDGARTVMKGRTDRSAEQYVI